MTNPVFSRVTPRTAALTPEEAAQAVCAQIGSPELFFPPRGGDPRPAKRVCNGDDKRGRPACPVRARCLEVALANAEEFGIFGGTSPQDRKRMKGAAA